MSTLPDRYHSLTLPSTRFTTHSRDRSFPSLLIKSTPQMNIPLSLVPPLTYGGRRKLEDCVEVIVPVGGKVHVSLEVCPDMVEEDDVAERVTRTLIEVFANNYNVLGLAELEPIKLTPLSSRTSSDTSAQFALNPLLSCPTHHPLSNHLIPHGHPFRYLTGIRLHFSWFAPRSGPNPTTTEPQSSQHTEEEEADLIIDDDEQTESSQVAEDQDMHVQDEPQQHWLTRQLQEGVSKLVRIHMIKRFPLIFDGTLMERTPTIRAPSALTSSLTHFLQTSRTHDTPLIGGAKKVLQDIITIQNTTLKIRVDEAARLPARKNPKLERERKRRRLEAEVSVEGQDLETNRERTKTLEQQAQLSNLTNWDSEAPRNPQELEPEERAAAYMEQMDSVTDEESGTHPNGEVRLARSIVDAVALIGRIDLENRRGSCGRMAHWRIDIKHRKESIDPTLRFTTPQTILGNIHGDTDIIIDDLADVPNALDQNDGPYSHDKDDLINADLETFDDADFKLLDDLWDDLIDRQTSQEQDLLDIDGSYANEDTLDLSLPQESLTSSTESSHSTQSSWLATPHASEVDLPLIFDDLEEEDSQSELRNQFIAMEVEETDVISKHTSLRKVLLQLGSTSAERYLI
nr:uncharacterized protein CI109_004596 [Kwoniella shandongensis]KAA5527061.1 hypothetical protein CI109_004596 [Kwoniella shandongensis]